MSQRVPKGSQHLVSFCLHLDCADASLQVGLDTGGPQGNPFMPMVTRTPGTSGSLAPLTSGLRVIPVDVLEDDKSYVLRADLPGMKKEDVNVEIDGQIVRISATKKDTKKWEDEGYKYHR